MILFGKSPLKLSGNPEEMAYSRQFGLDNLALAVTALVTYLAGWNFYAEAGLLTVLILFLLFQRSAMLMQWLKRIKKVQENIQ
jgi:hypothetical protein